MSCRAVSLKKKKKDHLTYSMTQGFLGIYARVMKAHFHIVTCTQMFIAASFVVALNGNSSDVHHR